MKTKTEKGLCVLSEMDSVDKKAMKTIFLLVSTAIRTHQVKIFLS